MPEEVDEFVEGWCRQDERHCTMQDRSPAAIERLVLSLTDHSTLDELSAVVDAAEWLQSRAKTIHQMMRDRAVKWIDRNGPFKIGNIEYTAGYYFKTKCMQPRKCAYAILDSAAGDFDTFLDALVAQPFKPAFSRKLLGDQQYECFFASFRHGALRNDVPDRTLQRADIRFAYPKRRSKK